MKNKLGQDSLVSSYSSLKGGKQHDYSFDAQNMSAIQSYQGMGKKNLL